MMKSNTCSQYDVDVLDTSTTLTLPKLLQVEDDVALLDHRCADTGALLWPHIRTIFFRMALADFLYSASLTGNSNAVVPRYRIAAYLMRAASVNALAYASGRVAADVCIVTSGVGLQRRDAGMFNRLSDYFAMQHVTDAITVEEHFEWQWQHKRYNNQVMFHAPLQVINNIGSRLALRARHWAAARELVAFVVERSERQLGWRPGPQRESALISLAARKLAGMPQQMHNYDALLRRIKPKIVLVLGASYGPSSTLILAARARNIVTAEFQHGAISPGHDGYNFSSALCNSKEYRQSLPDYFLSYGKWWNGKINAPIDMVAIGNPHREYQLGRSEGGFQTGKNVLLLSDGIDFDLYLQLARKIAIPLAALGLQVMIRPHPIERNVISSKYGACIDEAVGLDMSDDLYTSLRSCHAVISELSTGLFEAAGIARKLFLWDTPKARFCFPELPFTGFTSAEDLISLLEQAGAGELSPEAVEAFWAKDWQLNYRSFLEERVGLTVPTYSAYV